MTQILDCTLRDGSYVNNFQFTKYDTSNICNKLENSGIKYIEVGHGLGIGAYRKQGIYSSAATDEEYVIAAKDSQKGAKIGVFCIPGLANIDDIKIASEAGADFIRIGINVTEVEKSAPFIAEAKKLGLYVCTNYMKSYAVPPQVFAEKAKLSKRYGVDLVYLVDSAGGMLADEIYNYIDTLKSNVDIEFGYHGHDNLGLAVSNSLLCAQLGAKFVDSSLQGLGRSAGNASTEQLALLFSKMKIDNSIDLFKLLDVGFNYIQPLVERKGFNPIDLISGYALFHSSYMPLIRKYSNLYCIDPRELIIELCKVDIVNAEESLVKSIAKKIPPIDKDLFFGKYRLERYQINEQA